MPWGQKIRFKSLFFLWTHFVKELHIDVRNSIVSRGMILLFLFLHLEPGDRHYWNLGGMHRWDAWNEHYWDPETDWEIGIIETWWEIFVIQVYSLVPILFSPCSVPFFNMTDDETGQEISWAKWYVMCHYMTYLA